VVGKHGAFPREHISLIFGEGSEAHSRSLTCIRRTLGISRHSRRPSHREAPAMRASRSRRHRAPCAGLAPDPAAGCPDRRDRRRGWLSSPDVRAGGAVPAHDVLASLRHAHRASPSADWRIRAAYGMS
jgi:hypothetical protein